MDVIRLLKNDCMIYEKKRMSAEKGLENEITKLNLSLSNGPEDTGGVQSYKAVYQFLLNYPKNLSQFKIEYLLPNIARHRQIRKFLGERRGERWWIHIQNRENVRIINKTKEVLKKIHQRTTYEGGILSRTMTKDLSDLENQLVISDSFPQPEFLNTILGANISYNVIFWGSPKSGRSSTSSEEKSDLGSALNQICRYSGGKMVTITEPETGLRKIKNHSDQYYDLTFEFDGVLEEKKIRLLPCTGNMKLSYKEEYTKEEIDAWVRDQLEDTVQINDFSLHKKTIQFTLNSFQIDRKEKYGMLKVRVMLYNQQNTAVFQSENILRASKESVTISVPLPEKHQGDFKIHISVFDLLANTSTSDEHLITLHI
jgi:hypothetical protein